MEGTAMSNFLSTMTEVSEWLFGQVGTVGETIMNTPYLLVGTGIFLVGGAIGVFARLLHKH